MLELALAPQESLGPICVLLFLTGGFYLLWGASALASLQLAAPEHLRGQAASLYMFAFLGGAPLGGLLAGWLTARGGTQLAFAVAGTSAVLVAVTGAVVMLADRPAATRNAHPTILERGRGLTVNKTFSYTHCRFGVATRDVTPPVGIYARSWGAATHDAAEGVHRPFAATAAVFAPVDGDGPTLALVAVDLGWFQHVPDERKLRATILERTGLDEAALLINMSHTHAGANVNSQLTDKPGGELIEPYIEHLTEQIGAAILEAREAARARLGDVRHGPLRAGDQPRFLGRLGAEVSRAATTPTTPPTTRSLVARVTGEDGEVRATLFNYACHPTTLAWRNRLLSPDYIGAAREVLEQAFDAPALFLQGASGDLAPRDDYVGEAAVADRNGRQLGYAAAAAIESLPPAGTRFVYTGIVASGANLGAWEYQPCDAEQLRASEQLAARVTHVELRRKENIGVVESVSDATPDSVQEREKALRRRFLSAGARRRPGLRDAALDLAARRRAAGRHPQRALLGLPGRAAAALRRDAAARARNDEQDDGLPVARGDLRHRALSGAAVALRARLPGADDRGRRHRTRGAARLTWSSVYTFR